MLLKSRDDQPSMTSVSHWLLDILACPMHGEKLTPTSDARLQCAHGHSYPIVRGVPILFHQSCVDTIGVMKSSKEIAEQAWSGTFHDQYFVDCVGVSDSERALIRELVESNPTIDPVVNVVVAATNGIMYRDSIGKLREYPIPHLRMTCNTNAEMLLDVGCNWGRWSFAASRNGFRVVGIDPSLGSVMAAKRVASKLGLDAQFVVGDARHLPFKNDCFDRVFSYSVIQHFSKTDAKTTFAEVGRTLKSGGISFIQMPNKFGIRCLQHQAKRSFSEGEGFDVRYYSPSELMGILQQSVGETSLSADCFLGIGIQETDFGMMSLSKKLIIIVSGILTRMSRIFMPMVMLADSLYATSKKSM